MTFHLPKEKTTSDNGLGTGALVGIVVAAILIVILGVILITYCVRRRRQNKGRDRNNSDVGEVRGRHQEMRSVTAVNPTLNPNEQPYVYADGFIHENSSKSKNVTSGYDNSGHQHDDEEIYDCIDDSYDGKNAIQPNDVTENSYEQPTDSYYLTPVLPKRHSSNDDSSHPQPIGPSIVNGNDATSDSPYVQPDNNAGENSNEIDYLYPQTVLTGIHTEIDTTADPSKPTEGTEDTNELKGNNPYPTAVETSKSQSTTRDKSESKNPYDTLNPDDPNYTNLDGEPREYHRIIPGIP